MTLYYMILNVQVNTPGNRRRQPEIMREPEGKTHRLLYQFFDIQELTEWLQDLGLPSTGTTQEKLARLRRHTDSLVLPAESFPRQTIYYLNRYDEDILSEICQELGIDGTGPKEVLLTRIYREVGLREGWLQPLSEDARRSSRKPSSPSSESLIKGKTTISISVVSYPMCSAMTACIRVIPEPMGAPSSRY